MSEDNLEEARKRLVELKKTIKSSHEQAERETGIVRLNPSVHSAKIKFFKRMNETIKEKFRVCQIKNLPLSLGKDVPAVGGATAGTELHSKLNEAINDPRSPHSDKAALAVIKAVAKDEDTVVKDIEFLEAEFPLYGYMSDEQNSFLWSGKADAIALFDGNYVIVEWKLIDPLEYWEKNSLAYGAHLHQCLIYCQLLKLHLKLKELPYILIVLISPVTGHDIYPSLFKEFPKECTEHLAAYTWSCNKSKIEITVNKDLVKDPDMKNLDVVKVKDLFKDDITVRQLLDALGLESKTLKIGN